MFRLIKKYYITLAVMAGLFSPYISFAATQGTLGSTSTGVVNISVTKAVQAQITDLSDLTLANWTTGQGAVSLVSYACVYSSTGNYKVTATGSGAGNIFSIASGSNTLLYSVNWDSGGVGALGGSGTLLLPSVQSSGFATANTSSATCSGGGSSNDTARVIVGITSTAMQLATSSSTPYTGTLTMLITPY